MNVIPTMIWIAATPAFATTRTSTSPPPVARMLQSQRVSRRGFNSASQRAGRCAKNTLNYPASNAKQTATAATETVIRQAYPSWWSFAAPASSPCMEYVVHQ